MSFDNNIVTFIQTIGYNPLKKTPRVGKRKIVQQRKDFQMMAELIIPSEARSIPGLDRVWYGFFASF